MTSQVSPGGRSQPIAPAYQFSQLEWVFHLLPIRGWLLIFISFLAYAPARSLFGYFFPASSRPVGEGIRDFGLRQPQPRLRNWAILACLFALAAFIFTPGAALFARSPSFFPVIAIAAGAWMLFTVVRSMATGQVSPLIRGIHPTYQRATQPNRFWASMAWNAAQGCLMLWVGYTLVGRGQQRNLENRCSDRNRVYSPQDEIAACNELITMKHDEHFDMAYWISTRGIAYHRARNYRQALIDYSAALRLDPHDANTYYNRGLIEQDDNVHAAIDDYTAAISADRAYGDAYSRRGLLYLDARRWTEAKTDFSVEHQLHPQDPVPLANRAIADAGLGDAMQSQHDLAAAGALDPTHLVVPRAAAYISMSRGDNATAIAWLDKALKIRPGDADLLRWRADAYQRLQHGTATKAEADVLQLLSRQATSN